MEGECPHEPSSAVRKDGFDFHCGAPKISASLRLCVKTTLNAQFSISAGRADMGSGMRVAAADGWRGDHNRALSGTGRQNAGIGAAA